ncbi:MAG: hypothetical protein WC712_02480 [Candidatus Brocadiia bacterium]
MKRNAFVAIVSAFLLFSSLDAACFSEQVAIDDTKATPLALTVRFPEQRGFVVPKNAAYLQFAFLHQVEAIITKVEIFECKGTDLPRESLADSTNYEISVDKFEGKTVFAMVTVAPRQGAVLDNSSIGLTFISSRGEGLKVPTYNHTTGWVSAGEGASCDFFFRADSPIMTFKPILQLSRGAPAVSDAASGAADITEANANLKVLRISPFTMVVTVPAYSRKMQLCAEMELVEAYSPGGDIFMRASGATTPASQVVYNGEIDLGEAPARTRKALVRLDQSFGVSNASLWIVLPSGDRLADEVVTAAATGTVRPGGEGKHSESLDITYSIKPMDGKTFEEFDAKGGKATLMVEMNPFLCSESERTVIKSAVRLIEFYDDKGAKLR